MKKTGFATFARTSDESTLWCKDARSRHGTTLQRASCSNALQMHLQPWHVVTHLRRTRGHREGSRSRSRSPCSAPGNGGKGKGKGKNKSKHSGKGNGGNPAADLEHLDHLVRSVAQATADATAAGAASMRAARSDSSMFFDVQRSSRHACERRRKKQCSAPALPGEPAESPKPPFLGQRIGEAANPGPPDDAASRRDRTLHALAQMGLCCPAAPAASDAQTLSDTLSAHTPFATPREDPDHTTPGYSPASDGSLPLQSDVRAAESATRSRCVWHSRGPPEQPEARYRNSWLYVTLLHAAAGTLSGEAASAWNRHPHCGERWSRLVRALASAGPIHVDQLVALLHASPGAPKDSKPKTRCFASFPSCLIFSAHGSYSASARANHALRTVPPDLLAPYTAARDAAVWGTLQACLGATAEDEACPARDIALLPASPGGRGLSQAMRTGPAAYWAAWAGGLGVLRERCPAFSDWAVRCLTDARGPTCLRTASEARRHGWQHCASRTRNLFFRDHVLLPSLPPSHRALLRSQAGSHAAAWLQAIPSDPHTSITPEAMQIALRRRLRLQLPLAPGRCGSATYPELATGGAQALCVLGCEVGGRWNADAVKLVQRLVALRAHRAPPAVRASA